MGELAELTLACEPTDRAPDPEDSNRVICTKHAASVVEGACTFHQYVIDTGAAPVATPPLGL